MQKLLVHRVEPVYPAEARKQRMQGIIALNVVVGRDGSISSMRALNGPDILAQAAMDALRWWKFEPYRINGEPAPVETTWPSSSDGNSHPLRNTRSITIPLTAKQITAAESRCQHHYRAEMQKIGKYRGHCA